MADHADRQRVSRLFRNRSVRWAPQAFAPLDTDVGEPNEARCENMAPENNLTPEGQAWPLIC